MRRPQRSHKQGIKNFPSRLLITYEIFISPASNPPRFYMSSCSKDGDSRARAKHQTRLFARRTSLFSVWKIHLTHQKILGRHAVSHIVPEGSSRRVVNRFVLRILILVVFATLGALRSKGFGATFQNLLVLAAGFCIGLAVLHREAVFGRELTNWDEAAAFLLIGCAVTLVA